MKPSSAPFLTRLSAVPERVPARAAFPLNLPFVRRLKLEFRTPVTFFVGENGTGKSTLIEALAVLSGLPVSGGSKNEVGSRHAPESDSPLAQALRPAFRKRPRDGYFLRAEFQAHLASLLDDRRADSTFKGDPYALYGGKSLHARSHGEAFLAVLQNRIRGGLVLLDEPESALSPQRQLSLLAIMWDLVAAKNCQFIIATHSPVLLTFPGADIVSFDHTPLRRVTLEQTPHFRIVRSLPENPERYWKHLRNPLFATKDGDKS